jgi:hypothetical protein
MCINQRQLGRKQEKKRYLLTQVRAVRQRGTLAPTRFLLPHLRQVNLDLKKKYTTDMNLYYRVLR